KCVVLNDAPILHNTDYAGDGRYNPAHNEALQVGKSMDLHLSVGPGRKPGESDLIQIHCQVHKWMSAYAWAFDHPYAAVTDAKGEFEIKNAPAGAEVSLMYWHETFGGKGSEKELKKV